MPIGWAESWAARRGLWPLLPPPSGGGATPQVGRLGADQAELRGDLFALGPGVGELLPADPVGGQPATVTNRT
jgi:hypothetical protein